MGGTVGPSVANVGKKVLALQGLVLSELQRVMFAKLLGWMAMISDEESVPV